jgi:putative ABC transport system permease protein
MGRETGDAYLSTEPASATILLDEPIDAGQMAAIATEARERPGVVEATGRTQFDSDVEVDGRPREIPLQVFATAPDDPMRMAKFDVGRSGSWPPSRGEIFIGRDSLTLLGVAVGDTVTVTPPGGGPVKGERQWDSGRNFSAARTGTPTTAPAGTSPAPAGTNAPPPSRFSAGGAASSTI